MTSKEILSRILTSIAMLIGAALMILRGQQLKGNVSLAVLLVCIAVAVVLWVGLSCYALPKEQGLSGVRLTGSALLMLAGAVLIAAACAWSLSNRMQSGGGFALMITDAMGIIAGLCYCVIALAGFLKRPVPPILRTTIYLFLLVRLINDFRGWSMDPIITDYIFQQLALITVGIGLSNVGSLAFGQGCRRCAGLWCMIGVGMSAMAVSGQVFEVSLFYFGLLLLTAGSMMHAVKPMENAA